MKMTVWIVWQVRWTVHYWIAMTIWLDFVWVHLSIIHMKKPKTLASNIVKTVKIVIGIHIIQRIKFVYNSIPVQQSMTSLKIMFLVQPKPAIKDFWWRQELIHLQKIISYPVQKSLIYQTRKFVRILEPILWRLQVEQVDFWMASIRWFAEEKLNIQSLLTIATFWEIQP